MPPSFEGVLSFAVALIDRLSLDPRLILPLRLYTPVFAETHGCTVACVH